MPLYEYQCDSCGHRFERIQKFSDPPIETCPVCSGPVHKLISSPAIQFKGSGWYITDYSKKSGESARRDSGDTGQSSGGSDKKSESSDKKSDSSSGDATSSKPAASSTTGGSDSGSGTTKPDKS